MVSDKIKQYFKEHLIDSTSLATATTPIAAALENIVAGIPDDVSLKTRAMVASALYLDLTNMVRLRDYLKPKFGITEESSERANYLFDIGFGITTVSIIIPSFHRISYLIKSEEPNWGKITAATLLIACSSILTSGPIFHFMDIYRDLTGLGKSERTPEIVRNRSSMAKKGLAALLTVGAIGLTAGIYNITPDRDRNTEEYQQPVPIERSYDPNK